MGQSVQDALLYAYACEDENECVYDLNIVYEILWLELPLYTFLE